MKNQNKSNLFKIISINLFSVLFIIVLIELIFGYWFDKDNFGPFMREHRNKNNSYTLKYKGEVYEYVYKRNYYGFRGEHVEPDKIKAIMVSGSTGEERYKPDRFTITELLNLKLKDSGIDLKIINASISAHQNKNKKLSLENSFIWNNKIPNYINFIKKNTLQKIMPLQKEIYELDLAAKGLTGVTKDQFWQKLDNIVIKLTSR